jgi:hypothetical protein
MGETPMQRRGNAPEMEQERSYALEIEKVCGFEHSAKRGVPIRL